MVTEVLVVGRDGEADLSPRNIIDGVRDEDREWVNL